VQVPAPATDEPPADEPPARATSVRATPATARAAGARARTTRAAFRRAARASVRANRTGAATAGRERPCSRRARSGRARSRTSGGRCARARSAIVDTAAALRSGAAEVVRRRAVFHRSRARREAQDQAQGTGESRSNHGFLPRELDIDRAPITSIVTACSAQKQTAIVCTNTPTRDSTQTASTTFGERSEIVKGSRSPARQIYVASWCVEFSTRPSSRAGRPLDDAQTFIGSTLPRSMPSAEMADATSLPLNLPSWRSASSAPRTMLSASTSK
jgi:hypothetical protein